jgi:hypothetical protein
MRVSGCNSYYEFVLGAGAKAKSVTNNLPLLSVLWAVVLRLLMQNDINGAQLFLISVSVTNSVQ